MPRVYMAILNASILYRFWEMAQVSVGEQFAAIGLGIQTKGGPGLCRIARHPTTPAPRSGCQKAPTHRSNLGRPNRPIPEGDFYHSLGLPKRSVGYPRSATPHGASFLKGMSMGTCVGLTLMNTTSIAPVPPSTRPSQGDKWCRTTNKGS